MKRIISILLSALLLLFALPAFADGEPLQAGLYVSKSGEEILYLDDNPMAITNAAKAGMTVCGVLCPHTPANAAKMPSVTDWCIASFEELL